MNVLMKQLLTPNCPVDKLEEHKTEGLGKIVWPGIESKEKSKNPLNVHTMNICHYLLVSHYCNTTIP